MGKAALMVAAGRFLPPALVDLGRHLLGRGITFKGEFSSWAEARNWCGGYDDAAILERVLAATLAVRDGRAAFKCDATIFQAPQPPFPLLTMLLWAAVQRGGSLSVLDFGGALGSSYFQCRHYFSGLPRLSWTVVEQPHFVDAGRREFQDRILSFQYTLDDAWATSTPDLVLISGVLQYLPDPAATITQIIKRLPAFIVIDRTPLNLGGRDILAVQHVPAAMGRASYPLHLFSRNALLSAFEPKYRLVAEFDAMDGVIGFGRHRSRFKGFGFVAAAHGRTEKHGTHGDGTCGRHIQID